MKGTIRKLAVFVGLLILALMVNANVVQVVRADELNADSNNTRILIEEYSNERGPILVADTAVARSVETDGLYAYQRIYDAGPEYAPVTGFYSIVYGAHRDRARGERDPVRLRRAVAIGPATCSPVSPGPAVRWCCPSTRMRRRPHTRP